MLDLTALAVARLFGRLSFLGQAFFSDIEDAFHSSPHVGAGLFVGKPETETGGDEGRYDPEEVEDIVDPGYRQWKCECGAEDAAKREVLAALIGNVGGEVDRRASIANIFDPELHRTSLQQRAMLREIQDATYGVYEVSCIPK